MNRALIVFFFLCITFWNKMLAQSGKDLKLWSAQPASIWEEALPLGNGKMEAMVFGGKQSERFQINDLTLWSGAPKDGSRANGPETLETTRQAVSDGGGHGRNSSHSSASQSEPPSNYGWLSQNDGGAVEISGEGWYGGQIIDDPEAWKETSGTAMFTYAFITGVKNGWLDKKKYGTAARKGLLALISFINANDELFEVCEGTNIKNDRNHYMQRKRIVGDLHGQAPVLWCATALLR